jgi:hypothetical protein
MSALVDATALAAKWHVSREWIYDHRELLAPATFELGTGTRPRLRFDPELARQALAMASAPPAEADPAVEPPVRAQRRTAAPTGSILPARPRRRRS